MPQIPNKLFVPRSPMEGDSLEDVIRYVQQLDTELQNVLASLYVDMEQAHDTTVVDAHIVDKGNPHGVTVGQIGAETPEGAQAKVDVHTNRTDNPHTVTAQQVDTYTSIEIDNKILSAIPPGTITAYGGYYSPSGWLPCNGQAVPRTTYSDLFAAIGTIWGAGDGTTTFNVPDLRGEFLRGLDNGRGVDLGRTLGSWQADTIQHVTGSLRLATGVGSGDGAIYKTRYATTGGKGGNSYEQDELHFDASRVARTSTETRPRNLAVLYIIKY